MILEDHGPDQQLSDSVGITVGGRSAVLKVATPLILYLAGDAYGGTTVSWAPIELVKGGGLMAASHATLVVLPSNWVIVNLVTQVLLLQEGHRIKDYLFSTWLPHGLSAEVAMSSCPIPVTLDGLWVK